MYKSEISTVDELKMLTLDELKLGMIIDPRQLRDIIGVCVILEILDVGTHLGKIMYIGEPYTDKACSISKSIRDTKKSICCFYEPFDGIEEFWDE